MKSQQEEKKYQTNCIECICAKYENNLQTGCAVGRLENFINRDEAHLVDEADKKHYVITRICNSYRSEKWNNGILDIDRIIKESSQTFGIIIDTEGLNRELSDLIYSKIVESNYNPAKLTIILCSSVSSKNIHNVLYLFHRLIKIPIKTVTMNYVEESFNLFVRQAIKHDISNNFIFYTITDVNTFDMSALHKINDLISNKMEKLSVIQCDKHTFVLTKAFKDYLNTCPSYWMSLDNFILISKEVGYYKEI